MGFMTARARRGLSKEFRAQFDELLGIYEAAVKAKNPVAPWPPRVSYVASIFDKARRWSTKGRPFPEEVELAFLDEALDYASTCAQVDRDLLFTAAQVALARRNPRNNEHRRWLDAAMTDVDDEQSQRATR